MFTTVTLVCERWNSSSRGAASAVPMLGLASLARRRGNSLRSSASLLIC